MAATQEPAYVKSARDRFHEADGPLYQSVKYLAQVEPADLEETAKKELQSFLTTAWAQLAGKCLREWKKVLDKEELDLSTNDLQSQFQQQLFAPEDFKAEMFMSQVLDERDDVEEAKADFKVAFLAPQVTRVALYNCGDDEGYSGVVIAAQRGKETVLLFYYID